MSKIQWYPGHMAKTVRTIKESLQSVDIVIEVLDARIPLSSKNPELDNLIANKKRIVVFNKADLADDNITNLWRSKYESTESLTIAVDSYSGKNLDSLAMLCEKSMSHKIEANIKRGRIFTPIRMMIAGIPNVGKSTLINRFVGGSQTKTSDRPGVTRGRQWIRVRKGMELLDTPGILWPKFSDENIGIKLAITGAIKDTIFDSISLAYQLIKILLIIKPNAIVDRYKLEKNEDYIDNLLQIGKARGFLLKGGEIDLERSAIILLDEFRGGKLGKISLEKP